MTIDKAFLTDIIKEFAHKDVIFRNEAQFQFDLAWKMREKLTEANVEFAIHLEMQLSQEVANEYTDIVIEIGDELIPIELKYKLADKRVKYVADNDEIITQVQSAPDYGCYDYWKDVYRIEKNLGHKYKGKCVKKGFAIIIANYHLYWDKSNRQTSKWQGLCIEDNTKSCEIYDGLSSCRERNEPIKLTGKYDIKWENYTTSYREVVNGRTEHPFRYLILSIPEK